MNPKTKKNWRNEFRSLRTIQNIESFLDTYWDDEYILWKIRDEIKKWREG